LQACLRMDSCEINRVLPLGEHKKTRQEKTVRIS